MQNKIRKYKFALEVFGERGKKWVKIYQNPNFLQVQDCFQFQINKRKKIGFITKHKLKLENINSGFVKKLEDTNGKEFTKNTNLTTLGKSVPNINAENR